MALAHFILVLLVQGMLIYAEVDINENENKTEIDNENEVDDQIIDSQSLKEDWTDIFFGSDTNLFPTSSTTSMTQVMNSDKSPEEQLEDIKEIATSITNAIQSEMANLLTYALSITDNDNEDNQLRRRRSVDTPMDSTKLVWRLLKHIKSNNEYQNIAIEKMMSAQEIADKFGIEFSPDTEILSELAFAANEQAKELTSILKDACDLKNSTQDGFLNESENQCLQTDKLENGTCSIHFIPFSENDTQDNMNAFKMDDHLHTHVEINHVHYADPYANYNHYYTLPYETQIPSPTVKDQYSSASLSSKQSFYDAVSYNPSDYYGPYCSMELLSNTYIIPIDDFMESEPELIGEEFEETVSSKIYVDHEVEPGSATVNHVMTYTISEKAHYRSPQIENLPQQMKYYFLLV